VRTPPPTRGRQLSGRLVALMAVATGAIVANLYYAQPLLHGIARQFHAGATATSLIVTCTQAGYAAGLLLVVPLGDLHARRTLVVGVYGLAVAMLVVCAVAPALWVFEVASVGTGLASVGGQVMIPFAADLATSSRRGRVVARLMTGLLVGILLARTLSGIVAQFAGWRAIYWLSAGLMVVFAAVLRAALPGEDARPSVPYHRLVRSSLRLLVDEPALRRRAWYGAMVFAAFSVLWTCLAFLLAEPPYGYSNLVIGLFGLAGVGGVAAANAAGNLADASRAPLSTLVAAVLTTGSFGLLAAGRTSLGLLVVGIVVLDMGVNGMHITNQAVIYAVAPGARSRINSAYMTCYFVGGAVGSVAAGALFATQRWDGVCVLGGGFGLLALAMTVVDRLRPLATPSGPRPVIG
jgi:predicted MFS family arabinose efflux permease